jgi:adenylyl-sulfate kinase
MIEAMAKQHADNGLTVWLTGLSSAGKTTLSDALFQKLTERGYRVEQLDGDVVRQYLSKGLGFSRRDREENVRRIGFVAEALTRHGIIVLVSAISPYRTTRDEMRQYIGRFLEVFVDASLKVCEQRDRKGIYRRARTGELEHITGIDDPYEAPCAAEVVCHTDLETISESTEKILKEVECTLRRKRSSLRRASS